MPIATGLGPGLWKPQTVMVSRLLLQLYWLWLKRDKAHCKADLFLFLLPAFQISTWHSHCRLFCHLHQSCVLDRSKYEWKLLWWCFPTKSAYICHDWVVVVKWLSCHQTCLRTAWRGLANTGLCHSHDRQIAIRWYIYHYENDRATHIFYTCTITWSSNYKELPYFSAAPYHLLPLLLVYFHRQYASICRAQGRCVFDPVASFGKRLGVTRPYRSHNKVRFYLCGHLLAIVVSCVYL